MLLLSEPALEPLVFGTVFLFALSAAFQLWARRRFYVRSLLPDD